MNVNKRTRYTISITLLIVIISGYFFSISITPNSMTRIVESMEVPENPVVEETVDSPIDITNNEINFDEDGEEIQEIQTTFSFEEAIKNKSHGYYYSQMSDAEKQAYDVIINGLINRKQKIVLIGNLNKDEFKKVIYAVTFDNPLLYYVSDNYDYDCVREMVTVYYPKYTISENLYKKQYKEISNIANKIADKIKPNSSEYEKEVIIHDYLLTKCQYDLESVNSNNLYGALVEGKAACRGYSAAFSYLLNHFDVSATQIIGNVQSNGEITGHSWNMIKIGKNYYYTDACWNDIADTVEYEDIEYHYAFFNMTYDKMIETHDLGKQFKYLYKIPEENNTEYSYYISNGLFANSYEEAYNIIKTKLPLIVNSNRTSFMIQCNDEEIYQKLCVNITDIIKELIKNNNLKLSHCKYIKIDQGYTLIIHDFINTK